MARFVTNKMKMIRLRRALLASVAMLPMVIGAPEVAAQQITSGVRGTVSSAAGVPVAGARITITDSRTGRTTTVTTGSAGRFAVSGLEPGGPYTVLIETDQYVDQRIPDLSLSISDVSSLNITLQPAVGDVEEIVVTGVRSVLTQLALGPSSAFGLQVLEEMPSISHDFRDTIRLDPRVVIDPTNDDNISCLGGSNKFNSFTIDGVRTSDTFGLNASGLPSRNTMPIPFDAVRETSVEFSPFDVEYGQFTGCSINVVTKSGSNEFHGGGFILYNSDGLTGKTIDGRTVITESFKDYNWGADIGGPIIKDKLFFYAAYEETDDGAIQSRGPIGGGFASERGPTVATVEQIQGILESVYGQTPLGIARTLPEETRRILGRLDWFISDQHRLALTYTRLREAFTESDSFGFGNDFAYLNNFEISGSEIETYSARLFSDWTENFSTEIRVSRLDNHDIQNPVGGGEAQDPNPFPGIEVDDDDGNTLLSGPGIFRSANSLITQIDQLKFTAEYRSGDHTFTAGYELDQLDVFNLFVVNATGTIAFDSIADLIAGSASSIDGNGSFTGDINDAGATFSRSIHSIYIQDAWQATPNLTIQLGLRYDFFKSSDEVTVSQAFVDRYGFENSQAFDGLDILMPRLGITYDTPWEFYGQTVFRAGAGVFTGGDPTVWVSNVYTNFGGAVGFGAIFIDPCTSADLQVLDANGNFTGIPACIAAGQQAQTALGQGRTDAIDPNFKLPSVVRGSFGFTHNTDFGGGGFFDDWRIDFDIIHTRNRNAPDWVDLTLTPIGFAPDGRLIMNAVDPLLAGCDIVFLGPRIGFSPGDTADADLTPGGADTGACDAGRDDQDILLTNVKGPNGGSTSVSILLNKVIDYELFNKPAVFDIGIGYAYTKAKLVNPGQGSTATSNFEELALININNPDIGPSQFVNNHNLTLRASFRHQFIGDLWTKLSIFYSARSGRPFSYAYDNNTPTTLFGDSDNEERNLFYVPTGPNDPLADTSALDQAEFFAFLDSTGLSKFAGQIAPRNVFKDPWFKNMDLRFSQELPTPWAGHRFEVFLDFENFLNFINDGSNIFRRFDRGDVGEAVPVLDAALSADGTQYIYTNFRPGRADDDFVNASVWAIQLGIRYRF
ncbi:MAG: TonB-dependent receptor [Proteobacteria bacterium]|nr:TonB-dependent receptor [Pseudomonadota bacterium]